MITLVGRKSANKRRTNHDDTSDTISVEGSVMVTLPTWAIASSEDYFSRRYNTDEEMMSLAIHLSDRNITEGTGGPFGAAIFERHDDKDGNSYCTLASIGMNRVVPLGNSTLHGEVRVLTALFYGCILRLRSYYVSADISDAILFLWIDCCNSIGSKKIGKLHSKVR